VEIRLAEDAIDVLNCMIGKTGGRAHFEQVSRRKEIGLDRNESITDRKILDGLMANLPRETQLSFLLELLSIPSPSSPTQTFIPYP
jgi:hypothetical protein